MTVSVRSFAKINLGLRIGAARADGFHELLTVCQTIGLHDVIRVSVQRGSGIEIQCKDARVPRDETNTCYRIVEKALASFKEKNKRVVIEIEKRLPVQGGLGGASANAIATLIGLERALKKALPVEEKLRIASEIGSDVPLFLVGGTVLGVGRGERVFPLPDFPAMACVVVTPEVGVSTPKAFAEWDRLRGLKPHDSGGADAALKGRSSTVVHASTITSASKIVGVSAVADASRVSGAAAVADASRVSGASTIAEASGISAKGEELQAETAELRLAGQPGTALPAQTISKQTFPKLTQGMGSDRMNELGRGLSAWLSEMYSSAPSGFVKRRGRAGNPLLWLVRAGIENDFEQVIFPEYPELREGKSALLSAGAKYASLSGSGSTLYGLFASRGAAAQAVARLRKQGWAAQATSTVTRPAYWKRMVVR
jgi:4-diphosphocytidyl-2-C-methyl-D-erythritol kinase